MREGRRRIVFESRVLRRTFDSKSEGVTGQWRKLHSDELSVLYMSPNIFRVLKTRRKNCECHVYYWREERCIQGFGGEF
jgi:hypothetical protein